MPLPPAATAPRLTHSSRAAAVAQRSVVTTKVTVLPVGVTLQVSPEEGLQPYPDHLPIPRSLGVFEMQRRADGAYDPKLRLHTEMVRMKANITEELGLGITYASLRRLMAAGFVRFEQPTPGQYSFCLRSYFQHLANVRKDPEFWEAGHKNGNHKRYMAVVSEGVH